VSDVIQPIPWRGLSFFEKLALVLMPIVALGILLMPFLDQAFLRPLSQLPGMRPFVNWSVNAGGSWVVGLLLFASWVGLILLERSRLNNNQLLWFDTGCPQCYERELVRVNRQRGDRFYGLIGVRAYRYACRNCTWRGLRIGRRHHRVDEEMAGEELAVEARLAAVDLDAAAPGFTPAMEETAAVAVADVVATAAAVPAAASAIPAPAAPVAQSAWTPAIADADPATAATAPNGADESPLDWAGNGSPESQRLSKPEEIAHLKEQTGFTDEELEWLWRRVSDDGYQMRNRGIAGVIC